MGMDIDKDRAKNRDIDTGTDMDMNTDIVYETTWKYLKKLCENTWIVIIGKNNKSGSVGIKKNTKN